MFRAATEYALEERLPVIYLAANSGARVGLASEVKQCLQVRVGRWEWGWEGGRGCAGGTGVRGQAVPAGEGG